MNLQIKDYQRLFSHSGLRFLINELAMKGYSGLGVISIVKDDDFVCYMPKSKIEETSIEGLKLYSSKEKFDQYASNFRKFQSSFKNFCEEVLLKSLSKSQIGKLFELCGECINQYKKTEFIFVDRSYLESQKSENQELNDNLEKYEKIKFEFRDSINTIFFGKNSYYQRILEKLGKEIGVSSEDLQQYKSSEILELFEGKKVDNKTVKERFRRNVIIDHDGDFEYYWGKEAEKIIDNFLGETMESEVSGTIVNKGKITGIARIIKPGWHEDLSRIKEAMECMNKGDILVSETTSPDIMIAIRKAGAIVTDQGGLMSHAAIMAREMNVPGIVGCGNATKLINDGDLIEVDANNGTVRIIKKAKS